MDIDELAPQVDNIYYSDAYRKMIEDHLTYLRGKTVDVRQLTNAQCVKYSGDFYGLLINLRIETKYHYALMRVNNLQSAADYDGNTNQIYVPDTSEIDLLVSILLTDASVVKEN